MKLNPSMDKFKKKGHCNSAKSIRGYPDPHTSTPETADFESIDGFEGREHAHD